MVIRYPSRGAGESVCWVDSWRRCTQSNQSKLWRLSGQTLLASFSMGSLPWYQNEADLHEPNFRGTDISLH